MRLAAEMASKIVTAVVPVRLHGLGSTAISVIAQILNVHPTDLSTEILVSANVQALV